MSRLGAENQLGLTPEDRYCPTCHRHFPKLEHLRRHIRCHTKERPFRCEVCSKSYARNDTLLRHLRSHRGTSVHRTQESPRIEADQSLNIDRVAGHAHETTPIQSVSSRNTGTLLVERATGQSCHDQTLSPTAEPQILPWNMVEDDRAEPVMASLDSSIDPWLLSSSFDVGAVEWDLATTLLDWAGLPHHSTHPTSGVSDTGIALEHLNDNTLSPISIVQPHDHRRAAANDFQSRLLGHGGKQSRLGHRANRSGTQSVTGTTVDVNEAHRQHLTRILEPRALSGTLPPVTTLNLALELYFERFHPIFPIVHKATFRPSHTNALLLLSMYTIGTLFIGSDSAMAIGKDIFDRLNKVILVSWEQHLRRTESEGLAMVQAALLGQTYAFMYGNRHDAFMAEAFHGTTLCWVRKIATTVSRNEPQSIGATYDQSTDSRWRRWCHTEQKARLMLGIRIHDAELAAMFRRCPLLRHETHKSTSSAISLRAQFDAPDANTWSELEEQSTNLVPDPNSNWSGRTSAGHTSATIPTIEAPYDSDFALYSSLQSTNAYILELRSTTTMSEQKAADITSNLTLLSERLGYLAEANGDTHFHLKILCHLNFMCLSVDFGLLELAISRDEEVASTACGQLASWIVSSDCVRCMLHAVMLVEEAESVRVGQEYAIHVRRALFCVALLWTVLACLSQTTISEAQIGLAQRFSELDSLGSTRCFGLIEKTAVNRPNRKKIWGSLAYRSAELIRRFGRGKLSGTLAAQIVNALETSELTT